MTKIYQGRDIIGRFTCDGKRYTRWQLIVLKAKIAFKRLLLVSFVFGVIYGAFQVGRVTTEPVKVFADREVVREVKGKAPIMERIAKCESGGSHIDKITGQVLMRSNVNKTVDLGKFQINSVWFKKATELGLDITKEVDNEKMAYWIYENRGTNDWYASRDCWSK
jgi:hypothetical protein